MDADSTCDSHDHNHHRKEVGRHFLKCRKSDKICIQCTASGKYAPQLRVSRRIAYKMGELQNGKTIGTIIVGGTEMESQT